MVETIAAKGSGGTSWALFGGGTWRFWREHFLYGKKRMQTGQNVSIKTIKTVFSTSSLRSISIHGCSNIHSWQCWPFQELQWAWLSHLSIALSCSDPEDDEVDTSDSDAETVDDDDDVDEEEDVDSYDYDNSRESDYVTESNDAKSNSTRRENQDFSASSTGEFGWRPCKDLV